MRAWILPIVLLLVVGTLGCGDSGRDESTPEIGNEPVPLEEEAGDMTVADVDQLGGDVAIGQGVSVDVRARQQPISESFDEPSEVFAALIWTDWWRANLNGTQDPAGPQIGSASYPPGAGDSRIPDAVPMPPILVVVRGYPKWGSHGVRYEPSLTENSYVHKAAIKLCRDDNVWASYEAKAEPFTESFVLAGQEQHLAAGRLLLVDFAREPVQVHQIANLGSELAAARDALSQNPLPPKEERGRLQAVVRQLAKQNKMVRDFLGDALDSSTTHDGGSQ